ncbi:MAG: hypothetical protein JSS02_29755, partial [Planctomycetes bacterium]|nr:hypothetical protein [Planctomycetota bacterium]
MPLTAGQMRALALLSKVRPETPVPLFLITDPNKDPDDLSVLVISKYLHEHGFIDLRCVVTTLGNRETRRRRARFVKSVLNDLGLLETRVGVGVDYAFAVRNREGNVDAAATAGRERDHAVFVETPLLREVGVEDDGQQLLQQELQRVEDRSAVLLVVAGMTDAAFLLRNQGELVRQKARQVVIMGGVETNADER